MGGVYKQVRSLSQEALSSVVAGTIMEFFHLGYFALCLKLFPLILISYSPISNIQTHSLHPLTHNIYLAFKHTLRHSLLLVCLSY